MLIAINEGLADQVKWPDGPRRARLAQVHDGVFRNMIGVMDIREHEIEKSINLTTERLSWSTKHKMNSYKNLSVVDYSGRYIYVHAALAKNDRQFFTCTPLYMNIVKSV